MTAESGPLVKPRMQIDADSVYGVSELAALLHADGWTTTIDPAGPLPHLSLVTTSRMLKSGLPITPLIKQSIRVLGEEHWTDELVSSDVIAMLRSQHSYYPPRNPESGTETAVGLAVSTISGPRHDPGKVAVVLELTWEAEELIPELAYLSGEHLDEFEASASIATGHGLVSFGLVVPMIQSVSHSIAVVDIAWRLLDHPGVAGLLPHREPQTSHSVMVRMSDANRRDRYSSSRIDAASPLSIVAHRSIDAELDRIMRIVDVLSDARSTGRWTGAQFSRIAP